MAWEAVAQAAVEHCMATSMQGHAFSMEAQRYGFMEGKVGSREGLTHRIIAESGAGQSRAFLPGGMGGPPTVVPKTG